MWSVRVDAFRACLCCSECSFYHSLTKHIFVLGALVHGHPGKILCQQDPNKCFQSMPARVCWNKGDSAQNQAKPRAILGWEACLTNDILSYQLLYIIWLSIRFVFHTTSWYMKINDRKQCIAKQSGGCFYVFANRVLGFVRHFWSWPRTLWVLIGSGCGILYRHRSGSMVWDTVWGHDLQ